MPRTEPFPSAPGRDDAELPVPRVSAVVVYLRPGLQWEAGVELPGGATLRDAVLASGVLSAAPELACAPLDLGVFSHPRDAQTVLRDGDRVEIYRPLQIDPKEARRARSAARRGIRCA